MTQNLTIYTPTFMEKLLGRHYKWWYAFKISFKSVTTYRVSNIFYALQNLVYIFGSLLVWYVNYQAGSNLFEFKEIFTYFLIGIIINSFIEINLHNNLSISIQNGKLSAFLMRPSNTWLQYFFNYLGNKFFWNLDILLWLFCLIIFNQFITLPSFISLILVLVLSFIAILISFFISIILGSSAFFIIDGYGVIDFFKEIMRIFSGRVLPLNIFWFLKLGIYLPPSFLLYHPMQIYLGNYDTNQTILVFLGGLAWCLILYFLAKFIFKLGLKRNESVGL